MVQGRPCLWSLLWNWLEECKGLVKASRSNCACAEDAAWRAPPWRSSRTFGKEHPHSSLSSQGVGFDSGYRLGSFYFLVYIKAMALYAYKQMNDGEIISFKHTVDVAVEKE